MLCYVDGFCDLVFFFPVRLKVSRRSHGVTAYLRSAEVEENDLVYSVSIAVC